ncbi:hypothetical protein ND440_15835 [Yersinia ruckeri]|uniref:hypothetical protein n=1 Tax=Yersinia ruckeri TaxID=29486 RepID=UPI0020BD536E|nr:hypothetical protein [Yersinia ruckeri]MCW6540146.1 hypothetical protein [Yersinia ruckeri]MCW6636360.1 hypothetical protein [Yersinia ruckeri]UZX65031.1 hypothetical protein ND440_15835 [Yersinia ruckeri]UZY11230.1 hypothetical protein LNQ46_015610 [Yersinia ruckeri]
MKNKMNYLSASLFCALGISGLFTGRADAKLEGISIPMLNRYSDCKMALTDDDQFVQVTFNFVLGNPFRDKRDTEEDVVFSVSNGVVLSLYFYDAGENKDMTITDRDILNLRINNQQPKLLENDSGIHFTINRDSEINASYHVSFEIRTSALKKLAIGASAGRRLITDDEKYFFVDIKGISFGPQGNSCESYIPMNRSAPMPLKVDPKFRLDSAVWRLKTVDLDELIAAKKAGFQAEIMAPLQNQLCLNYRPLGLGLDQDLPRYAISATGNNTKPPNDYFRLTGSDPKHLIHYSVRLNRPNGESFILPGRAQEINLTKNIAHSSEKICWWPNILLYPTESTDQDLYSDTLSFTLTPLS